MKTLIKHSLILILTIGAVTVRASSFIAGDEFVIYVDTADLSFDELMLHEEAGQVAFTFFTGRTPKAPVIWLKINSAALHNADYLYLSNYIDHIGVYYTDSSDPYSIGGRIVDFNLRSFQRGFYRNVVAVFPEKGATYIKISSFHGYSIQNQSLSHIQAVTAEELDSDAVEIFTSTTLITGMEIIILIINLALWWLSRNRTVGFYISVIATGMVMAIIQNQTFIHFFDIPMVAVGWMEIVFNLTLIYFFHAFSAHYLEAETHSPKINKALTLPFFPAILILVLIRDGAYFPIAATVYVLISFVLIFILIYRGWEHSKSKVIVYVTANFALIIMASVKILALNEVIPHRFLTTNLPFLGFLIRDTIFTIDLIRGYIQNSNYALERKLTIDRLTDEKAQLKRIEELKNHFFNNASHELRTPLTLILSPLEESIKSGKIPKELEKELSLSLKNGKYLLQLVNEILDLAKLEKGELNLIKEDVEVIGLISEIQENFLRYAREKKQRIFISHVSQELYARLDKDKFEKIINNLLSNAIKYSDKPGDIFIQIIEDHELLEIRVNDHGIGIAPEEINAIFERYYQSSSNFTQGTGIGLSIVKEFTNLHNGTVRCESQIGKGSQFILEFPNAVIINNPSKPKDSNVEFDKTKRSILLLEDHTEMRTYLHSKLQAYNLLSFTNGHEGIAALRKGYVPDLIITDYVMPKMNGYEFASSIKENVLWASIPIIFLTARALDQDKEAVLNLGVDDYIIKPFNLDELKVRIEKSLQTAVGIKEILSEQPPDLPSDQVYLFKKELDAFMLKNVSKPGLNNEDLSYHFSLSERNLYRRVKAATGQSPASYIREVRLQKARMILSRESAMTVSEIAYKCGIDNVSHFSQLFKKRFGTVPSKFRYSDLQKK